MDVTFLRVCDLRHSFPRHEAVVEYTGESLVEDTKAIATEFTSYGAYTSLPKTLTSSSKISAACGSSPGR